MNSTLTYRPKSPDTNIGGYRYFFNGQEGDNEIFGENSLWAFKNRLFNSRLSIFLSPDPEMTMSPYLSPYIYVKRNPIFRKECYGNWDITVHVYNDREKYGYGIAIVTDNKGNEVFRFMVRAEGVKGRDRMLEGADTPLGTYDIPDKGMYMSGGSRLSYGPNPRLILNGEAGEIIESGRTNIRIHGGRQEIYNSKTKQWEPVSNPSLKKTEGCLRAYDIDMENLKKITDKLMSDDSTEIGGKLYIKDDLIEKNGQYIIPTELEQNDTQEKTTDRENDLQH